MGSSYIYERGFDSLLDPPPYTENLPKIIENNDKNQSQSRFKFRQRHFRLRTFLDFLRKCHFPNPTPFTNSIIIFETSTPSPNQHFFKKSTSYVASAQSTRTKMTAIWFSSYELFVKMDTFQFTLRLKVSIFVKNHFFILSNLKIVFKGLCVPTSEASCSSYFMKADRQKPTFIFPLSPQPQDQKNPGHLQTEAQHLTV